MGDINLHARKFGENAVVKLMSPEEVDAARLLPHMIGHRGKRDLASELSPALDERHDAADKRPETCLHVHDALAVESAILDRPVEGVPLPSFAHWLGVENGRLYGHGVMDVKAGLGSLIGGIMTLIERGTEFRGNITFAAVADHMGQQ